MAEPHFALRVGAFFGALFLVYGATLPYLPVLLDARGLNPAEIGVISSTPLIIRLFLTPAIAMHADRRGDHRAIIIALSLSALAALQFAFGVRGFWPILLCISAFMVAIQSIMPLIETVAMAGVKTGGHDYGRMRLWGSVTFILVTFAGAWLIGVAGPDAVVWLLGIGTALTLAAALALPKPATAGVPGRRRFEPAAAWDLICSKHILLFLVAAGAVQSAHAVFYAFGVLHWRANGVPPGWIGTLWSIGVISEIALFWWSARVLGRFSAVDLLCIGAGAAVVRWTLMAFDPPLALLVPLQVLHGLTYGACHLGAMHFIQARVPEQQAGTMQALYSTVTAGIGMGGALILAGYAYKAAGGLSYLTMTVLAVAGLLAGLSLRRT
jgi:MFS transporter, PPP family, 3-phenylpropionic acid transporter